MAMLITFVSATVALVSGLATLAQAVDKLRRANGQTWRAILPMLAICAGAAALATVSIGFPISKPVGFAFTRPALNDAPLDDDLHFQAAAITEPSPGTVIRRRHEFVARWAVSQADWNQDETNYFWLSLALADREGLPSTHYPKFQARTPKGRGVVYDGGQNPTDDPQHAVLLLLRVDTETHHQFRSWMADGVKAGWTPLEVNPSQVVAQTPIVFP